MNSKDLSSHTAGCQVRSMCDVRIYIRHANAQRSSQSNEWELVICHPDFRTHLRIFILISLKTFVSLLLKYVLGPESTTHCWCFNSIKLYCPQCLIPGAELNEKVIVKCQRLWRMQNVGLISKCGHVISFMWHLHGTVPRNFPFKKSTSPCYYQFDQ